MKLSPRESEIANLLRDGASSKRIAEALSISPNTVDKVVANLRLKLDAPNRAAIVARFDALQRPRE